MLSLYYLAYGSNLHPLRLIQRVPSARPVDVIELPGRAVNFHKRSKDRSGKCNLTECELASSYGALYEFSADERSALDLAEGLGRGYRSALLQFSSRGQSYAPYVYVAESAYINPNLKPYSWYLELVVAGAKFHRFPPEYIATLEKVVSVPDPDAVRAAKNAQIIVQLSEYSGAAGAPR